MSVETLTHLIELGLPSNYIARLLSLEQHYLGGWSKTISASYRGWSDDELDSLMTAIKSTMPDAGYIVV